MDDLDNLFFDLRGAQESMTKDTPEVVTSAPAPTSEPPATTEPTPAAPVYLEDYETPEAVEDVLREEWGADFESKYEDASKAVGQFFKNDDESLQWLAARIGNHPLAVKLALRLAAIYSGNGLPEKSSPAATATKEIDAQLKDIIDPSGKHYDRWIAGDKALNEQRIALYSKRWPGKLTIS